MSCQIEAVSSSLFRPREKGGRGWRASPPWPLPPPPPPHFRSRPPPPPPAPRADGDTRIAGTEMPTLIFSSGRSGGKSGEARGPESEGGLMVPIQKNTGALLSFFKKCL